ncbi:MAG: superinfection immunity protein [Deltaproteobacteria bacterium]|nr:superinfection immunity protein [Deltaproteobacteria bacterium]
MLSAAFIGLVAVVLGALALVIYLIPAIVAFKRKHRNRVPILLVNVILGWLYGVAWIVALIWAFTDNTE